MIKKRILNFIKIFLIITAASALLVVLPSLLANLLTRARTYQPGEAPIARVGIVFGAGLQRDGSPSAVLRDRVAVGVDLYLSGKVQKLLMSGDNRFETYNEPAAMRDYAVSLGVPEADIVMDYAGRRTYDTCYRAQAIFGIEQALLVTQNFHLPRAIFTCRVLGVDANGVSADRRAYRRGPYQYWRLREVPATFVAAWEVLVSRPLPVLGTPEPIFPVGETSSDGQPSL